MWVGEVKGPFPRLFRGIGGGTSSVDWKDERERGREGGREGGEKECNIHAFSVVYNKTAIYYSCHWIYMYNIIYMIVNSN